MPGIDQDLSLRAGGAGEQKSHAPIGDVGVIKGRFEGLVLDEYPLIRREMRVGGAKTFVE